MLTMEKEALAEQQALLFLLRMNMNRPSRRIYMTEPLEAIYV